MQRSKQQALMFLLGAVLVGGVLGAASDRVWHHQEMAEQLGSRHAFYERIGLSATQQNTMDSLLNQQDCAIRGVLAPQKPALDSIRASFHAQIQQIFTPEQQGRLDAETKARHDRDAREGKEQKRQCSK